jgi:signal transduction histidine kinase
VRRSLAQELHDQIGQTLVLAKSRLTQIRDGPGLGDRAEMQSTIDLLGKCIEETRTLMFELSPPILYDLGLLPALSWLAETLEKQHGLEVEIVDDAPRQLDDLTANIVFRSVRELLMNVVKHAGVTTARVEVRTFMQTLHIKVEDEGRGFDPAVAAVSASNTFGLFSVREQLSRLSGSLELNSAPGRGTCAVLSVPIRDRGTTRKRGVS